MTYNEMWRRLAQIYDSGEAKAIARMVLEERFGLTQADIYADKVTQLSEDNNVLLQEIISRLEQNEPVQYILGTAWFCSRQFNVAPGVLIPRPETEDLCEWIVGDCLDKGIGKQEICSILDIGCGSGCISISLALGISQAEVTGWDISCEALKIACGNAERLGAHVDFEQKDALNLRDDVGKWDVIVSNPPYICRKESGAMARNVIDYEPDIALFVENNNPLLFYKAISEYASRALKDGGSVYFETNPLYIHQVMGLLKGLKFNNIETKNDIYGKQRFVKGTR